MLHLPQGYNSGDCQCGDYHSEVLQGEGCRETEADNLKSRHAFAVTDQEALVMCPLCARRWVRRCQRSNRVRRGTSLRWDLKKRMLAWMCRVHWEGWGHCKPTRTRRNGCGGKGEEGSLNADFWTRTKEGSVTYDDFQIWGFWGGKGNLG